MTNKREPSIQNDKRKCVAGKSASHLLKDEIIELANAPSLKKYLAKLRRATIWDEANQHRQ